MLPDPRGALVAALLFTVHPVHTESVAFVSGVTDLLAAAFVLLAVLLWVKSIGPGGEHRRPLAFGGVLLCFFLACLSKESAFILPPVLLGVAAVIGVPSCRGVGATLRRLLPFALGFAAVAGLAILLRFLAGVHVGQLAAASPGPREVSFGAHLSGIAARWALYFRLLLCPWPLNALYTPRHLSWTTASVFSAVALVALSCVRTSGGSRPRRLAGLLWIVAFLIPVSGIVPIAGAPAAERFLYLPSIGMSLVFGSYLGEVWRGRFRGNVAIGCAIGLLLLFCGATFARNRVWRSEISLFTDITGMSPDAPVGHGNLGRALLSAGRAEAAVAEILEALRLQPAYPAALFNLGLSYETLKRDDQALTAYRRARELLPGWAAPSIQMGEISGRSRRWPEAVGYFEEAVRLEPRDALARKGLGLALLMSGETERARREHQVLRGLEPALARELGDWIEKQRQPGSGSSPGGAESR